VESLSDIVFQGASAFGEGAMTVKRVDFVGESVVYIGHAAPGTLPGAAGWRIKRLTFGPGDDVTEEWAGGTNAFNKVWDNRAALAYS
jgi:hypothetical protein